MINERTKREGRKAATQALIVIAESIKASRGRRSKGEMNLNTQDNA